MAVYTRTGDRGETGLSGGARLSKGDWLVNAIGQVDELNSQIGLAAAIIEATRGVRSSHLRKSYGGQAGVQELQAKVEIGLASLIGQLRDVQRELFEMGAVLAGNIKYQITNNKQLQNLNNQIQNLNNQIQNKKDLESRDTQRMAEEFVNKIKTQDHKITRSQDQNIEMSKREELDDKVEGTVTKLFDAKKLEQLIDEMDQDLPRLANFILPGGGVMGAQLMVARSVCRRAERELVRYLNSKRKVQSSKQQLKTKKSEVSGQLSDVLRYLNRLSDYLFTASRWVNWLMQEEETVWKRD